MPYTLGQAAKAAGVGKTTIRRAIERGRLSAIRNDDGSYAIDPAEVCRVYPPATVPVAQSDTPSDTGGLAACRTGVSGVDGPA